jgi:hypothetical protein
VFAPKNKFEKNISDLGREIFRFIFPMLYEYY